MKYHTFDLDLEKTAAKISFGVTILPGIYTTKINIKRLITFIPNTN